MIIESELELQPKPRKTKKLIIAGTAALSIAGLSTHASMEHVTDSAQEKFKVENQAAEAIALGYDCSLASVEDLYRQPEPEETSGAEGIKQRTVVKVGINLKERASAQPYFEKYANDDSVAWKKRPGIKAWLHDSPIPTEHDQGKEFAKGLIPPNELDVEDSVNIRAFFTPKVNYPDGASASVYAVQQVNTSDGKVQRYTVGYMYCGELKLIDGHWTMDPLNETSKNHLLDDIDVHTEPLK